MFHPLSTRDFNIVNSSNAAVPAAKPRSPQARPQPLLIAPRRQHDFLTLAIAFLDTPPDQRQLSLHSLVHGHDHYADPALRTEMIALHGKRDRHALRTAKPVSPAFCLQTAYQLVVAMGHFGGMACLNELADLWRIHVVPQGRLSPAGQIELVGLMHGILSTPVSATGRHFVASRETVQKMYRAALDEAQHQFMDRVRLLLTPLLNPLALHALNTTPAALQPTAWALELREWCRSQKEQIPNAYSDIVARESMVAARKFKQDIVDANCLLAKFQRAEMDAVYRKLPRETGNAAAMVGTAIQSGQDTLARELFSRLLAGDFSSRKAKPEVPKPA